MTTLRDSPASTISEHTLLNKWDRRCAFAGAAVLALTAAIYPAIPSNLVHFRRIADDPFYRQAYLRLDLSLAGVFIGVYLLTPLFAAFVRRVRPLWRDAYTYVALAGVCVFLWFFVVHFGRWQFGAWDFNLMIDTGWRQFLGQRPYVDFPATTSPGFNLGVKYAFQVFGVSWDATLYATAIMACGTFLWMYWLMTLLAMGRLASFVVGFAIECAGMLTLCFWWYNDTTLTVAAVFLLACLAYARKPDSPAVQGSYVLSLALFSLMKPNIAGLMIAGGVALLFFATPRKKRLVLLTLGATLLAVAFLALNHVPIAAMIKSYLSVAKSRGRMSDAVGFRGMLDFDQHSAVVWVTVLSLPLLGAIVTGIMQIWRRDWHGFATTLMFPFSLMVVIYGLATNGELRDIECTVLLASAGVIAFGWQRKAMWFRRITIAILCASIAGDLHYGAARTRVYGIGPHLFFEWQDNQHTIESGFLKNMRVSAPMIRLEREIREAVATNPGPFFMGSRLEFNYPEFGLTPPDGFPSWCPGTEFPVSDEPRIIRHWEQDHLQTLIFLKEGFEGDSLGVAYTYYPQEFLNAIHRMYVRDDDSYPDITVYRLRAGN